MKELNIFDIGSRGGFDYSWFWLLKNSEGIRIHSFEADSAGRSYLNPIEGVEVEIHPFALSDKCSDEATFFLTNNPFQSSFYEPNSAIDKYQESTYRKRLSYTKTSISNISTLDNLLAKPFSKADLIKIDTQGSEYSILKGGENFLIQHMPILALETWCTDVYKNIPLDFEIMSYARSLGYELFGVDTAAAWKHLSGRKFKGSKQRLIGNNMLFVPCTDKLLNLSKDSIQSKLLILCYYGFYDYANFIAEKIDCEYSQEMILKTYKADLRKHKLSRIFSKVLARTKLGGHALKALLTMPKIT